MWKFTFSLKEKSVPFADTVGEKSPKRKWRGRAMKGLGMNTAKSLLGRNVNLHLKDGSVIVNVVLAEILMDEFQKETLIKCVPYGRGGEREFQVPLKSIAWAELLNLNWLLISG